MDKLFGVYFMEALAEANAEKAVVCAVCRTYGGTLMNRHGGGYICRECRRKEKEDEARNNG